MRTLAAALLCTLAVAAPAAQSPLVRREATVVREFPAGYGHALTIVAAPAGSVTVSAWRERRIRVESRLEIGAPSEQDVEALARVIEAVMEPGPTTLAITTKGPHDKQWMKSAKDFPKRLATMPWRVDYTIPVPEYTSVSIVVGDGATSIDGVSGIVSALSAKGPVRLSGVSGATRVEAAAGDVEVATRERSWRGGNLTVSAAGVVRLRVPPGFAADVDASAPDGVRVTTTGEEVEHGPRFQARMGAGDAGVTLTSGSRVEIVVE